MKLQLESGKLQQQFCRGSAWEELQLLLYVSWFIWDGILPSWVIVVCENFSLKRKSISSESRFGSETALDTVRRKAVMGKIFTSPPASCAYAYFYLNRTLGESDKPRLPPDDLTTNFTLNGSFVCIHKPKGQPLNLYSYNQQPFSAKISTGFLKESGCKHCLYWALHSYNFILCPLRRTTAIIRLLSPVKPGLLRPKQILGSKSGSRLQTRRTILVLFHHLASEE